MKWKVSRTRLMMFWVEKGSILPPPLNLIPNVYHIVRRLRKRFKCCEKVKTKEYIRLSLYLFLEEQHFGKECLKARLDLQIYTTARLERILQWRDFITAQIAASCTNFRSCSNIGGRWRSCDLSAVNRWKTASHAKKLLCERVLRGKCFVRCVRSR